VAALVQHRLTHNLMVREERHGVADVTLFALLACVALEAVAGASLLGARSSARAFLQGSRPISP
jgi:hypothetical protein